MLRRPVVSGRFYPGGKAALLADIEKRVQDCKLSTEKVLGAVCPHAGYMYSGRTAALTLSKIAPVDTFIIFGPNHTGLGTEASIMTEGEWQTPLGNVEIDSKIASEMLSSCKFLEQDSLAHQSEHSIEVQLPFLQYFFKDFKIVPVCLATADIKVLEAIGKSAAAAVKRTGVSACIIASSDMTHYESAESAKRKDELAIKKLLALDGVGLAKTVRDNDISMCGWAPAVAMLAAVKELGATKAELVEYTNSGEESGDFEQVVGYAGIIIK